MVRHLAWVILGFAALSPALAVADPPRVPPADDASSNLALAAACLERGEDTTAISYLTRFIASHPDQALVRASLAELLWRHGQLAEAREHFERFLNDAQVNNLDPARQVQAHTRLLAIAQHDEDAYAEHLHRGIGLYLLARQSGAKSDPAEGLLCKAAGELTLAQRERPEAARPHWYLYLVWSRLGQSLPAARSLRHVAGLPDASDLTPAERHDVALATELSRGR